MILGANLKFENVDAGYWMSIDPESGEQDELFEINYKASSYYRSEDKDDVYELVFNGAQVGLYRTLNDAIGAAQRYDTSGE